MARKRPVIIWTIKHRPKSEPKFHQIDKLLGAGRSTKEELIILIAGWDLRMGLNIKIRYKSYENGRRGPKLILAIFTTATKMKNKTRAIKSKIGMFIGRNNEITGEIRRNFSFINE